MKICAPNLGEGIRSIKIVRILKQIGDWVEEDENLLEVETDKSMVEIPSPVRGRIKDLLCSINDIVPVGQHLITIEAVFKDASSDRPIFSIETESKAVFTEPRSFKLPKEQYRLSHQLVESQSILVPATIERIIDWQHIKDCRQFYRSTQHVVPTSTELLSWALAQAMLKFDKFRVRCSRSMEVITHDEALIGIAVALPNDMLRTAVVSIAKDVPVVAAIDSIRRAIMQSKTKEQAATAYHSVTLSNMSHTGIRRAVPVVVHPAIATICVGAPYEDATGLKAACNLTFDHRIMNGVYAASFLKYFAHLLEHACVGGKNYGKIAV